MNKKVLSLVLALVIVLGSFGTVLAADPLSTQDQKIQWLIDNEVVAGRKVNADGSADLALDEFLTRAEVTKLIVYTLKLQNLADALKGVMQPFPVDLTGVAEKGNLATGEYNKDAITLRTNEWNILPRYAEATVKAEPAPVGKVFAGFKVTGSAVKLTENLANREATFQMPETGDVKIEAVYEVAADATVKNTGKCDIQIVAVNGVKINALTVNKNGGEQTQYNIPNVQDPVKFKIGDKIIISMPANEDGTCGTNDCKLVGFDVKGLCAAGNTVNADTLPLTTVNPGPCGGSTCVEIPCAATVELSCVTEIAAVGKEIVNETIGAHVVRLDDCAGDNCAFEVNKVTAIIDGNWTEITGTTELDYAKVIKKEAKLDGSKLVAYVTLQAKEGYKLIDNSDPANPKAVDTLVYRIVVEDPYTACVDECEFSKSLEIEVQKPCTPCTEAQ